MRSANRHLILPSETRYREFDAKLLLACHAAERGWRVVIGSMRSINRRIEAMPRGIYIDKGVTRRKVFFARSLPRIGFTYAAWDEEGLVYASPEVYRATKVDVQALNHAMRLFAWGDENALAWRGQPGFAGTPISVTGNPRSDLLRTDMRGYFEDEAERLRRKYGAFILINTNFSRLNHFIPDESLQQLLLEDGGGKVVSRDDPRLGLAAHKKRLFEEFRRMAPEIARRFPDHRLVLRPHPSESPVAWREALADCPNAEVVHEGNVAAWLMTAGAMVHNGCTTAVESFLLDRPAIAYQPVVSEQFDHPLPNLLSRRAFDLDELAGHIANTLNGGADERAEVISERRAIARRHIASYGGPSACENIVDALEETIAPDAAADPGLIDKLAGYAALRNRRIRRAFKRHLFEYQARDAYKQHTFPPVTADEVTASITRFSGLNGRFGNLAVEDLGDNVFAISRA